MAIVGVMKPGPIVQREKGANVASSLPSTSIAGFIGETIRGPVNSPILVSGWKEYLDKFAKGYSNPYTGKLSEHVQRFFDNGGSELYITRVVGASATKAKATIPESTGLAFEAKEEGVWGNDVKVEIKTTTDTFSIVISVKGTKVEQFDGVTNDTIQEVIKGSNFVTLSATEGTLAEGAGTLATGSNGSAIALVDYKNALNTFDVITENIALAIPGITMTGVQEALASYASGKLNIFGVHDGALNATDEDIKSFKDSLSGFSGALYHPWIKVVDPMTGNIKDFPLSSSICGLIARTDATRGIQKAPAGNDAYIVGAVGVSQTLSDKQVADLNAYNINCVISKKNRGIVVWGARLLKADADREFVSDLRLDMFIEKLLEMNTDWVTFEPIDDALFSKVQSSLTGLMDGIWREGKLKGAKANEAYFVKCDKDLNPDPNSPVVNIEVGYAKKKPAEFIVTRIVQMRG